MKLELTPPICYAGIIAIFATLSTSVGAPSRMNELADLRKSLQAIGSAYAEGKKADASLALTALGKRYYPQDWISEIPSRDWASPSQERMARINEINQAIAGSEEILVEMTFDAQLDSFGRNAAQKFLYYGPPSAQLKAALLSKVESDDGAYMILFETGLFEADVRSKFVEGLSVSSSPVLKKLRAGMAAEWGLVEALPVYLQLLQEPFDPKTISFVGHIPAEDANSSLGGYSVAAEAAMHLGLSGAEMLPLMKQRFAEIQAAFPERHQAMTGKLKAAIDVIEGRRPPSVRAAMSGRGAINLTIGASPVNLAELPPSPGRR